METSAEVTLTGITRRVDSLGRIVLPAELRRYEGLTGGDRIEVFVDGDAIVLRKYARGCVFCGRMETLSAFGRQQVCQHCRKALVRRARTAKAHRTKVSGSPEPPGGVHAGGAA